MPHIMSWLMGIFRKLGEIIARAFRTSAAGAEIQPPSTTEFAAAVDNSVRAVQHDPAEAARLVNRGLMKVDRGNLAGAVEDQATALEAAVDDAIADGGLVGTGSGNSSSGRLGAFANMIEAQQLAQGRVYIERDSGPEKVRYVHNSKLNRLSELLEELQGEPALVFYGFRHDVEAIRQAAKQMEVNRVEVPRSPKELGELLPDWNDRKINLLAVHAMSAAHGLNLQRGSRTCIRRASLAVEHQRQRIQPLLLRRVC